MTPASTPDHQAPTTIGTWVRGLNRVVVAGVLAGGGLALSGCGRDGNGAGAASEATEIVGSIAEPASTLRGQTDGAQATLARAAANADGIVVWFRDEPTAMAAVLLARDAGYSAGQIVDAGAAGRLEADGEVLDESGSVAAADGPPTELFIDDVSDAARPRPPGTPADRK